MKSQLGNSFVRRQAALIGFIALNVIAIGLGVYVLNTKHSFKTGLSSLIAQDRVHETSYDLIEGYAQRGGNTLLVRMRTKNRDALQQAIDTLKDWQAEIPRDENKSDNNRTLDQLIAFYTKYALLFTPSTSDVESDNSISAFIKERSDYFYETLSEPALVSFADDPYRLANQALTAGSQSIAKLVNEQAIYYREGQSFLAIVEISLGIKSNKALLDDIERMIRSIETKEVELLVSGQQVIGARIAAAAEQEMMWFSLVALLLTTIVLVFTLRRLSATFIPILCVVSSGLFAALVCMALFSGMHLFAMVLGLSLIGVVIDYAIHAMYYAKFSVAKVLSARKALITSALSSGVAYLLLLTGNVSVITEVAVFAVAGILYALSFALCYLALKQSHAHKKSSTEPSLSYAKLNGRIISYAIFVLAGSILVLSSIVRESRFHVQPSEYFTDSSLDFFQAPKELLEVFRERDQHSEFSIEPGRFIALHADSLDTLYAQAKRLRQLAAENPSLQTLQFFGFDQATVGVDLLLNKQSLSNPIFYKKTIEKYESAIDLRLTQAERSHANRYKAQRLMFEQSGREELEQLIRQFAVINKAGHYQAVLGLALDADNKAEQLRSLADLAEDLPGIYYVSMLDRSQQTLKTVRKQALWSLAFGLLVLMALAWFFFGRRFTFAAGIGLACVLASALTIAVLLAPLTLFGVMALFLVLGLGIDYVVFVRMEAGAKDFNTLLASHSARNSDGFPGSVAVAAASSLISFSVLSFSQFQAIADFAYVLFLGTFGCFVLAYLLYHYRCTVL